MGLARDGGPTRVEHKNEADPGVDDVDQLEVHQDNANTIPLAVRLMRLNEAPYLKNSNILTSLDDARAAAKLVNDSRQDPVKKRLQSATICRKAPARY